LQKAIVLVLLDSNIFILDRFFPRDSLYSQNKTFVEKLVSIDAAISSFTLLEICGVASFRLSSEELAAWLFGFTSLYPVYILDVHGLKGENCEAWWSTFVEEATANIAKKMTFGDAVLLREAENYDAEAIVTWNTKDFSRRIRLTILTPTGFLRRH
jgi:predicted nucleic acid-binding protein